MANLFRFLGMASGFFGALLILFGVIGFLVGGEFLGVRNFYNWFYIANSFLFFAIFCIVLGMTWHRAEGGSK